MAEQMRHAGVLKGMYISLESSLMLPEATSCAHQVVADHECQISKEEE
jgi:hypothetical protein